MNKIKTIFISNILEAYFRSYDHLPKDKQKYWYDYDKLDANRALFYGGDDKVVVTSVDIDRDHLGDISDLCSWENIQNLVPEHTSQSLSNDLAKDDGFFTLVRDNPGVGIIPYHTTSEFYDLIDLLVSKDLSFRLPETMARDSQFIGNYANSKRGFRHYWEISVDSKLPIKIPFGFILSDRQEVAEACWWFRKQDRAFVIKYNRGVQGVGVLFNNPQDFPDEKLTFLSQILSFLSDEMWNEGCIIVEEKVDVDNSVMGGSPNVEFSVGESGKVSYSYGCEQLLEDDCKTFRGIEINPKTTSSEQIQVAKQAGFLFGEFLSSLGYRGVFDIDLVVGKDRALYAVESNLRRTGGTHLHEAATSVLGYGYDSKWHLMCDDIKVKNASLRCYKDAKNLFKDLLFSKDRGGGILFGNPDLLRLGILHVFIIAGDETSLRSYRSQVEARTS